LIVEIFYRRHDQILISISKIMISLRASKISPFLQKALTARSFGSTKTSPVKVAVLGAAGGIGQPLSLLLKLSNHVDELACYDIVNTPGVAADISHVRGKIFLVSISIFNTQLTKFCE
jgi:hypothetical protein